MCVSKIKAEKDFYKSLYRQIRHENINEPKFNNLPPKPQPRKLNNLNNPRIIAVYPKETMSTIVDDDNLDMFDILNDKTITHSFQSHKDS